MFDPPAPLRRTLHDRLLGGVCGGLARHLGWDPMLVRVTFLVLMATTLGTALVVYIFLWLSLPADE